MVPLYSFFANTHKDTKIKPIKEIKRANRFSVGRGIETIGPFRRSGYKIAVGGGFEPPTERLAIAQNDSFCGQPDKLRLFRTLHPRDRRACLPVSTPYIVG